MLLNMTGDPVPLNLQCMSEDLGLVS
jgi:hypothetical protein